MKTIVTGITLSSIAFVGSILLFYSAYIGHQALADLKADYGVQTVSGWYDLQPARDLFHGPLAFESELLYHSPLIFPVSAICATVGLLIGCSNTNSVPKRICLSLGLGTLFLLGFTWTNYADSIYIVSVIVD